MKYQSILAMACLLAVGTQALPKTTVGDENGIIIEDDGTTKVDGESGITVNGQGQTTNVGGSSGITIEQPAGSNSTAAGQAPKAAGNSTSGTDGLAALLGAAEGASSSKNSTGAAKSNTTASALPPGVSSDSQLASIFGALEGARKVKKMFYS